ncbi:MAG: alkaline phosphatase family protein [Solirubrobacterales bacterium]
MASIPRVRAGLIAVAVAALAVSAPAAAAPLDLVPAPEIAQKPYPERDLQKIKHVIFIVQENRSFDHYFGTYPGADGIPMLDGVPTVCLPDAIHGGCQRPLHNVGDVNGGGPHGHQAAVGDIDGGAMDGFLRQAQVTPRACRRTGDRGPQCAVRDTPDVLSWHDAREIPNYWAYAENFVLQDRMFASVSSSSVPVHLAIVSGWSARCAVPGDSASCVSALGSVEAPQRQVVGQYAWTDITWLLYRANVSWRYYVLAGRQPDCTDDQETTCAQPEQAASRPSGFNPLPLFSTVAANGQEGNVVPTSQFYTAAATGMLPAVSWVVPNSTVSEHPPSSIAAGQAYVTGLINAVMRGPQWKSTAIFVTWDDWGGFYDHAHPPSIDVNGYGMRVPGLLISPYARRGVIDHQTLSFDAYLKFVEDVFLRRQRLDPSNDGRYDPRPTVREDVPRLGDLSREFDFAHRPRRPLLLDPHPKPGRAAALTATLTADRGVHRAGDADVVGVTIGCNDRCTATPTAITNGQRIGLRERELVVPAGRTRRFTLSMSPRRVAQLQRARAHDVRLRLELHSRIGPERVLKRTVALPPPPRRRAPAPHGG